MGDEDGDTDDGDTDDGDADGGDAGYDCGERTVTALAPAGFYEFVARMELDADPADSALARVVLQAALCPERHGTTENWPLYEIDADGRIVAMISLYEAGDQKLFYRVPVSNQVLVLRDGCVQSTGEPAGDDGFDPDDLEDDDGPCGPGAFAITREGMVSPSEVTGPYSCVEFHSVSACQDCWVEDGVWHQRIVTTSYFVATGTLSGISVYDWAAVCDPDHEDATVTINSGDRVDCTWTTTIEYRRSQDPADMGYVQISYAPD